MHSPQSASLHFTEISHCFPEQPRCLLQISKTTNTNTNTISQRNMFFHINNNLLAPILSFAIDIVQKNKCLRTTRTWIPLQQKAREIQSCIRYNSAFYCVVCLLPRYVSLSIFCMFPTSIWAMHPLLDEHCISQGLSVCLKKTHSSSFLAHPPTSFHKIKIGASIFKYICKYFIFVWQTHSSRPTHQLS